MKTQNEIYEENLQKLGQVYSPEHLLHLHCNAVAIFILEDAMKRVPDTATIDQELNILKSINNTLKHQKLKTTVNPSQSVFLTLKKIQTINNNERNPIFQKLYTTQEKRLLMFESIAQLYLNMITSGNEMVGTHNSMKLISDLYNSYVLEYQLFVSTNS